MDRYKAIITPRLVSFSIYYGQFFDNFWDKILQFYYLSFLELALWTTSLCCIIFFPVSVGLYLKSRVSKKARKKVTQGKNNVFVDGFAIFLRELRFVLFTFRTCW